MSVEFEKIVLEKLTNLENNFTYLTSRVDNLSEELHETKEKVNNNTNLINSLSGKVDDNTNLISSLSGKVDDNTNLISSLSEKVDDNTNLISSLSEKVDDNTNLINSLSEKVDTQGLNFAKFEHEFNMKVQALFDSFVANTESHLSYEKSIATLNAKTFHHDARISVLEDKNKNSAIFAHN